MARLRITCGDGIEQTVELREQKLRIGRGRDNDLVLPDPQKGVSRVHAELRYENGRYVILDLQSQNGTWVNGRRVERAEVPAGAEIALGEYRLILQNEPAPGHLDSSARETRPVQLDEFQIRDVPGAVQPGDSPRATARVPKWIVAAIAVTAIVAVAAVVRTLKAPAAVPPVPKSDTSAAGSAAGAPATADAPEPAPRPAERLPDAEPREDPTTLTLPLKSPVAKPGADPTRPAARVARRPGETAEAWRARGAALNTRYGYSKAALDRGDFAAAAGGFEAILLEEPGYLDAPKLLVQAQAGLRATARSLFQAGTRLDAAGDWVGAVQKYEQARQVYAGLPGLPERLQRAREKLRIAGTNAFNAGREHEANGRLTEALREYEKAVQWLPADDPNRQIARSRVDQLRRN